MHLIGRWWRAREMYGPNRYGPALLIDRKWRRLLPVGDDCLGEWWKDPRGVWHWIPAVAGGVGTSGFRAMAQFPLGIPRLGTAAGSQAAIGLDSSYSFGSNDAIGGRFMIEAARTLSDVYFFITAYTGTASLVNDLNWELRIGTLTAPTNAGGDLVASGSVDPASATGWIRIPSLSATFAAQAIRWIIIGDADGGVTNFASVLRNHTNVAFDIPIAIGASTANGWTTPTRVAFAAALVLGFAASTIWYGSPFSAAAAPTSNTNRKGLRIDGLTEQLSVLGWYVDDSDTGISGIELFEGTAGPGSTPLASSTAVFAPFSTVTEHGAILSAARTLSRSTVYRFVLTFSAAAATPRKLQIGTGVDANLRAAMPGVGNWYYAEANGTTDWANDDLDAYPALVVLVADQVQVSGSLITIIND